jgi:copper chaperone
MKTVLKVIGMSCEHCERAVVDGLTELGASSVKVDLQGNMVTVEYDETKLSLEAIKSEIDDMGYEVKS